MSSVITPLLEGMSKAARAAWPFIQRAVSEGLGTQEIIDLMEAEGLKTFRRQDMLALIREAGRGELLKSDIARWPTDAVLPIDRVRQSITKIVAPFSYTLRVRIVDALGRERTITRQAHSQQLRSGDVVSASFMEAAAAREQYQQYEILDAEVIDVQQAGELGVI